MRPRPREPDPDGPTGRRAHGRAWRWSRRATIVLAVVVLLLVAVRLALPHVVLRYANRTLAETPGYYGQIEDVDLSLWRGAYQIQGLDVRKTGGEVPVPFFSSREIDFSVQWSALFDGAVVGEIDFREPTLNIVAGPTEEETQAPVDARWQDRIQELFPLEINRFEVHDGRIHYRDFHATPEVDVPIDDLHVLVTNLTNSRQLSRSLVAELEAEGRPLGDAVLDLDGEIDPYATDPTFNLNATLEQVDLTKLNDFIRAYGGFDVQGGRLDVYSELAASDGRFTGYVKPLVQDLDVADLGEDTEGPIQAAWEGLVSVLSHLFRNQPEDQFGTRVEFSGSFDRPDYSVLQVVGQVFRNAFIDALPRALEDEIELRDAAAAEEEADAETEVGPAGDGESSEAADEDSKTADEDAEEAGEEPAGEAPTGALGAELED